MKKKLLSILLIYTLIVSVLGDVVPKVITKTVATTNRATKAPVSQDDKPEYAETQLKSSHWY